MKYFDYIYEPEEDSKLLLNTSLGYIKNSNLKICEVGVGSGFIIKTIKEKYPNNQYIATDINKYVIEYLKENLNVIKCNLLEKIEEKQDIILFNPPYLPLEKGEKLKDLSLKDKAIYGGKKGYEIIEEFIYQINDKLKIDGKVLLLFSSFSNKEYIFDLLDKNLFEYKIISQIQISFEKLYVVEIKKSDVLKQLKDVKNLKYFSKGKHSIILEGVYNNHEVIVKTGNFEHIQIEEIFLNKLKDYSFTPKIYKSEKEFIVIEKINSIRIKDFLEKSSKEDTIKVLDKILKICSTLDNLGINKFELTNPYKHILIDDNLNVKFIDFERCLHSLNPKNTRQILQYFLRQKQILKQKEIYLDEEKIYELSSKFKECQKEISIEEIFL